MTLLTILINVLMSLFSFFATCNAVCFSTKCFAVCEDSSAVVQSQFNAGYEDSPVVTYALIEGDITVYSDSLLTRAICTLPDSYYVIVLGSDELKMHISYYDITGYIHPTAVQIVDYEPITKFATAFRFFVQNDGYPATLRSSPDHESDNKVAEIPNSGSGMLYGSVLGTSLLTEVGNLWYYVKYEGKETKYNGYVYKSQVRVEAIEKNSGARVEKTNNLPSPASPFETKDIYTFLLILALTLPAALITFLIFKKPRSRSPRYSSKDDNR